jgi:hypothetical protein
VSQDNLLVDVGMRELLDDVVVEPVLPLVYNSQKSTRY